MKYFINHVTFSSAAMINATKALGHRGILRSRNARLLCSCLDIDFFKVRRETLQ